MTPNATWIATAASTKRLSLEHARQAINVAAQCRATPEPTDTDGHAMTLPLLQQS